MSEIDAIIRKRTNSNVSEPRTKLNQYKSNIPVLKSYMDSEFRPKKKSIQNENRKVVKMKMDSFGDEDRSDAFKRNPRSMIRRFSRAATFKNARNSKNILINYYIKIINSILFNYI